MCARGIKNEPYEEGSKSIDIEQFKDRLESVASSTQDPRCKDNLKHNLFTLLAIIFCAVIADANSISAIHQYAVSKKKWLMTWLDFDEVPSYNTFWWLLVRLDPKETEMFFRKWTSSLSKNEIDDFIAIDGKRVRGASNKKKTPKSLLHSGLRSLSMLISYRTLDGRTTEEIRYYISSLSAAAEKISKSTRGHWGIENQVHWVLDVTFQEDGGCPVFS